MAGMDPLEYLRDSIRQKIEIKEDDGQIILGDQSWPKNTKTRFLVKQPRDPLNGKYYTLGEVMFFLKHNKLSHPIYVSKAEAQKIRPLHRADRKDINAFFNDGIKSSIEICMKQPSDKVLEPPTKKLRLGRNSTENGAVKDHSKSVKTTSAVRASPRRQSAQSFAQPVVLPKSSTPESIHNEIVEIQASLQNLTQKFESVTSFLKDTFGLTPAQLQIIYGGRNDSPEYFEVIQCVRNNIAASIQSQCPTSDRTVLFDGIQDKQCYQAEKHPERGWGVVKKDLLSVLTGNYSDIETSDIENRHHQVIENCLARGGPFLKQSFSLLISRMLELNKSKSSDEEIEELCYNTMEKCLTIPLEDFRNMFDSLLSAAKTTSHSDDLERWISVSRMELKKLLQSLMMSYQSLRDIPNSSSSTILFQFPEPTLSMALNASKVTHSIVLDMYVRIGLAELRRILISLISAVEKTSSHDRSSKEDTRSEDQSLQSSENIRNNGTTLPMLDRNGNSCSEDTSCNQSFSEHTVFIKQEEVVTHDLMETGNEEPPPVSHHEFQDIGVIPSTSTDHTLHVVVHETPQISVVSEAKSHNKNVNAHMKSSSQHYSHIRRVSKPGSQIIGDNRLYTMFKASLGNVLVSSFKKQIQEKIQASNNNSNWS